MLLSGSEVHTALLIFTSTPSYISSLTSAVDNNVASGRTLPEELTVKLEMLASCVLSKYSPTSPITVISSPMAGVFVLSNI